MTIKMRQRYQVSNYAGWNLYWVESDGLEDCFVIARNSRSACRVERDMNGFELHEVKATRIISIPKSVENLYKKRSKGKHPWPWYTYDRKLLKALGALFRDVDGIEEMLLEDVVYQYSTVRITKMRSIGLKALSELKAELGEYCDYDTWKEAEYDLLKMMGICIVRCQRIERYIAHSFILGISKKQRSKYKTIDDFIEGWKKKTLGNMLNCIEEAYEIHPLLRANFQLFLKMRNTLIHDITVSDRYNYETSWGQKELIAFLSLFDVSSCSVERAFRSTFYASIDFASQYLVKDKDTPHILDADQIEATGIFIHLFSPKNES